MENFAEIKVQHARNKKENKKESAAIDSSSKSVKLNKSNIVSEYTLLHTLKASCHDIHDTSINILIDNGSTYTVITKMMADKLKLPSVETTILDITTMHGESKDNQSNVVKIPLKNQVGEIEIKGYTVDQELSYIENPKLTKQDFTNLWPQLDRKTIEEISKNQVTGLADILIGQDNI